MNWNLVQATVHNEARLLVAVGGVILLTLTFDRLSEMLMLAVSMRKQAGRNRGQRGLRATLYECASAASDLNIKERSAVEMLSDQVRLRLPKIHSRWWAHHDPAIATFICLAPLAGMATTLVRLCTDPRPTAMVGEALAPTVVGIVISMAASLLALAMQLFDFPTRMIRFLTVRSLQMHSSNRPVILRSHAAPVMAVVFFVAFGDVLLGLWVRALAVEQMNGHPIASTAGEVAKDGLGASPVYLELTARRGDFILAGVVLPPESSLLTEVVERVVAKRAKSGLPPPVTRVVVRCHPDITVGVLQRTKMAIQSAILRVANSNTVVQFEECVVTESDSTGFPGESGS